MTSSRPEWTYPMLWRENRRRRPAYLLTTERKACQQCLVGLPGTELPPPASALWHDELMQPLVEESAAPARRVLCRIPGGRERPGVATGDWNLLSRPRGGTKPITVAIRLCVQMTECADTLLVATDLRRVRLLLRRPGELRGFKSGKEMLDLIK